ncbi:ribosomal protein L7/L12 [Actinopolymorpha sp. B11F2]|uniref:ribosomal protein L7/L12 n=1 Tax=Actinopolymorpha sp. B11F2 TaxID=3160862 RepID=UPI0032E470C2
MDGVLIFLGIVVICFLVGVFSWRKRPKARDVLSVPVEPAALDTVLRLLLQNKKIMAIKELRVATGLGLAEAKSLAEAIQRGHRPPSAEGQHVPVEADQPHQGPPATTGTPDLAERARALRVVGRETEAIRLVCDETGMGILDSQKFVRAL